jgi:hypothetical protein
MDSPRNPTIKPALADADLFLRSANHTCAVAALVRVYLCWRMAWHHEMNMSCHLVATLLIIGKSVANQRQLRIIKDANSFYCNTVGKRKTQQQTTNKQQTRIESYAKFNTSDNTALQHTGATHKLITQLFPLKCEVQRKGCW